ncbi:hypothetical protein BDF14DRAFT_1845257 [Spinellus fusiger]|nr:hypothetical protein BDF14DRAFT_1845257 [Spinellus fusiger]
MVQWNVKNKKDVVENENVNEAKVTKLVQIYNRALQMHQSKQFSEAKRLYTRIINSDTTKTAPTLLKEDLIADRTQTMLCKVLPFLAYKNYGEIMEYEYTHSDEKNSTVAREALKKYSKALEFDPKDASLWCKAGNLAMTLKDYKAAHTAYGRGLSATLDFPTESVKCTLHEAEPFIVDTTWTMFVHTVQYNRLSPNQWLCLEGVCSAMHAIGNSVDCSLYVDTVLKKYPTWEMGRKLVQQDTPLEDRVENRTAEIASTQQPAISVTLMYPQWTELTRQILVLYHECCSIKSVKSKGPVLTTKQDSRDLYQRTSFIHRKVKVHIKREDASVEQEERCTSENQITADQIEEEKSPAATTPEIPLGSTFSSNAPTEDKNAMEVDPNQLVIIDLVSPKMLTMEDMEADTVGSPNKRKREDDNEETIEEEQDSEEQEHEQEQEEPEEKRATLRASKRQQEKIQVEKDSRIKMLDEERIFVENAQRVLDKLWMDNCFPTVNPISSHVDNLLSAHSTEVPLSIEEQASPDTDSTTTTTTTDTSSSTAGTTELKMDIFWAWFNTKVSELDANYYWNMEPNQRSRIAPLSNLLSQVRPVFRKHPLLPSLSDGQASLELHLLNFVDSLNNTNSGPMDSLHRLVFQLLEIDAQEPYTDAIEDTIIRPMVDILLALDHTIYGYIAIERRNTQLVLRLCECLVDQWIYKTMVSTRPKPSISRSKAPTKDETEIQDIGQLTKTWVAFAEHFIRDFHLLWIHCLFWEGDKTMGTAMVENIQYYLRFLFIQGKIAECQGKNEEAVALYKQCETVLARCHELAPDVPIVIPIRCQYDNSISLEKIQQKLLNQQASQYIADANVLLEEKNYARVIEILDQYMAGMEEEERKRWSPELDQILLILGKAYFMIDNPVESWKCYSQALKYAVENMVKHATTQVNLGQILSREEDVEFFEMLKTINNAIENLTKLALERDLSDDIWGRLDLGPSFKETICIVLRMSIYYLYRHADFIALISRFTASDLPEHSPSAVTKKNPFNDTVVRLWVLQSILVHVSLNDLPIYESDMVNHLSSLLKDLHEELGEREICSSADGIFLNYLVKTLPKTGDTEDLDSLYQCYHCLYGIILTSDSEYIQDHATTQKEITQESAEMLFNLVKDTVLEKLNRGVPIKNDVKHVIDILCSLFKKLPVAAPRVKHNAPLVKAYLSQKIPVKPTINELIKTADLQTRPNNHKISNISSVYFHIFLIKGKMLRINTKNRGKSFWEKSIEDLKEAGDQFIKHVSLCPDEFHGWYELALCLSQLSEEILVFSAAKMNVYKTEIASYQRKSFLAFLRAWYLCRDQKKGFKTSVLFSFYSNFGHLLYSMAGSPMNMKAFRTPGSSSQPKGTNGVLSLPSPDMPKATVYKLALAIFSKATLFKSPDSSYWKCHYRIGKCLSKLGSEPEDVLKGLKLACEMAVVHSKPQDTTDVIREPIYALCSYLAKYLYAKKIDPSQVKDYFSGIPCLVTNSEIIANVAESSKKYFTELCMTSVVPETYDLQILRDKESAGVDDESGPQLGFSHGSGLTVEETVAYKIIFDKLTELRTTDKRKMYHRPIFRQAWMHYNIFKNVSEAKKDMLLLFNVRSNTKQLMNIWKSDSERPGKHYDYIREYTLFLIDLAKATKDSECIELLGRRLRRMQDIPENDKQVYLKACSNYLGEINKY